MLVALGIECTAHTFGVGIVREDGEILSNERIVYRSDKGGIHPREAAELHLREFDKVLLNALWKAGFLVLKNPPTFFDILSFLRDKLGLREEITSEPFNRRRLLYYQKIPIYVDRNSLIIGSPEKEISYYNISIKYSSDNEKLIKEITSISITNEDLEKYRINLIAVSRGPGLYPTLILGNFIAKLLALKLNIPIVGVNHCVAHVEIAKLVTGFRDPVVLYVSGANTQVIAFEGGKYRIFGETLDMGVGNFLDAVARLMGLGFPGGPKIAKLAERGKNLIKLPYTVKGMDIQLGGLYTYIRNLLQKNKNISLEDLAYSIQEYVFAMLTEITERAIAHLNKKEVVLTGGVAANDRLNEMVRTMAESRNVKFGRIPIDLATDNGAMIAWTGILWYKMGKTNKVEELFPDPYWRTDQVEL